LQQSAQLTAGHAQISYHKSLRDCASSEVRTNPSDAIFTKFTVVPGLALYEVMTQTASDAQESQAIFGMNVPKDEVDDMMLILV
jgi:uncharacterized protein with LGFP repeats